MVSFYLFSRLPFPFPLSPPSSLSVCFSVSRSSVCLCPCITLSVSRSVFCSVCLHVSIVCLTVCLSVCLSVCLPVCLSHSNCSFSFTQLKSSRRHKQSQPLQEKANGLCMSSIPEKKSLYMTNIPAARRPRLFLARR